MTISRFVVGELRDRWRQRPHGRATDNVDAVFHVSPVFFYLSHMVTCNVPIYMLQDVSQKTSPSALNHVHKSPPQKVGPQATVKGGAQSIHSHQSGEILTVEPRGSSISTAKSLKPKPKKQKRHGAVDGDKQTCISSVQHKKQAPSVLETSKPTIEGPMLNLNTHGSIEIGGSTGERKM